MDRRQLTYVHAWYVRHPNKTSTQLLNMLLADAELANTMRTLNALFALPPPQGRGVYAHH